MCSVISSFNNYLRKALDFFSEGLESSMHFSPLCLGWGVSDWEREREREEGGGVSLSKWTPLSCTASHTRTYTAAALKTNQNKKETFVPFFPFTLKVHKRRIKQQCFIYSILNLRPHINLKNTHLWICMKTAAVQRLFSFKYMTGINSPNDSTKQTETLLFLQSTFCSPSHCFFTKLHSKKVAKCGYIYFSNSKRLSERDKTALSKRNPKAQGCRGLCCFYLSSSAFDYELILQDIQWHGRQGKGGRQ